MIYCTYAREREREREGGRGFPGSKTPFILCLLYNTVIVGILFGPTRRKNLKIHIIYCKECNVCGFALTKKFSNGFVCLFVFSCACYFLARHLLRFSHEKQQYKNINTIKTLTILFVVDNPPKNDPISVEYYYYKQRSSRELTKR